jgi:diguanylate cyclase
MKLGRIRSPAESHRERAVIGHAGSEVLVELIQGLGVMALIAVLFGSIHRRFGESSSRSILLGVIFGIGVLVSLGDTVPFGNGVYVDARGLFLGFASAFGGPVVGAVALLLGVLGRVALGGGGALAGVIGMFIASAGGYLWYAVVSHRSPDRLTALVLLGLIVSAALASCALMPPETAFAVLSEAGPLVVAANVCGAVVLGLFLEREMSFIVRETALATESNVDPLTGLLNRRGFEQAQDRLLATVAANEEVAIVLIDIDNFKSINDRWGHGTGDRVLRAVGQVLGREVRATDAVGRIGGEEFAVLLTGSNRLLAFSTAERIRKSVAELVLSEQGEVMSVTVSLGLEFFTKETRDSAYREADVALYQAKQSGRNRTVVAA